MDMQWWQFALTVVTSLTVGGIITSIITIPFQKKKSKEQANQEAQRTVDMQIEASQEIIRMYKEATKDIKELSDQREELSNKKLEKLERQVNELIDERQRQDKLINSQSTQIKSLERIQNQLKLEIEKLRLQSLKDCETCSFKEICEKYKAKHQE